MRNVFFILILLMTFLKVHSTTNFEQVVEITIGDNEDQIKVDNIIDTEFDFIIIDSTIFILSVEFNQLKAYDLKGKYKYGINLSEKIYRRIFKYKKYIILFDSKSTISVYDKFGDPNLFYNIDDDNLNPGRSFLYENYIFVAENTDNPIYNKISAFEIIENESTLEIKKLDKKNNTSPFYFGKDFLPLEKEHLNYLSDLEVNGFKEQSNKYVLFTIRESNKFLDPELYYLYLKDIKKFKSLGYFPEQSTGIVAGNRGRSYEIYGNKIYILGIICEDNSDNRKFIKIRISKLDITKLGDLPDNFLPFNKETY